MKPIGPKVFFAYFIVGCLAALLSATVMHGIVGPTMVYPDAGYIAYQSWQTNRWLWEGKHSDTIKQAEFEESLAGLRAPEMIENRATRAVAKTISDLRSNRTDRVATGLSASADFEYSRTVRNCRYDECSLRAPFKILDETARLERVLNGDVSAITTLNMPPELVQPPTGSHPDPIRPSWAGIADIVAADIGLALGYLLCGTILARNAKKRTIWRRPLASYPNFALGWAFYIMLLPGFGLIHLVRAPFIPLFKRQSPYPEYDELLKRVDGMIEDAEEREDEEAQKQATKLRVQIESTAKKAQQSGERIELESLEEAATELGEFITPRP